MLCLIDFGMVGRLMPKDKYAFAGVFISMAQQDAKGMADSLRKLSIDDDINDIRALEYDLNDIIEDFAVLDVSEANMADLSTRLQRIMYDYKLRVPGAVFIILRALAILEGIGKMIHPSFNTSEFIEPYGRKLLQEQYSAQSLGSSLWTNTSQMGAFLNTFPIEMRDILIKTRKGKLNIQIEHKGYDTMLNRLDRMVNRLIVTFIIVALIIGSALSLNIEKKMGDLIGLTYLGILGIIVLSVVLLYAVIRSRHERS